MRRRVRHRVLLISVYSYLMELGVEGLRTCRNNILIYVVGWEPFSYPVPVLDLPREMILRVGILASLDTI